MQCLGVSGERVNRGTHSLVATLVILNEGIMGDLTVGLIMRHVLIRNEWQTCERVRVAKNGS